MKEIIENGVVHQVDEYSNGEKRWYVNKQLHRRSGPAIEYSNGDKAWFFHDQLHRLDGPAIEIALTGEKFWWFRGEHINCSSQNIFKRLLKIKIFW